jgi:type VI secretion system secreted protein Hcp
MAVDAFIYFTTPTSIDPSGELAPKGETQDAFFSTKFAFEIKDFSFDVENPHTIGSATGGAGSGKIKFNEFTIKKSTDKASTIFFKDCVFGIHYQNVVIALRKSGASSKSSGMPYLEYCFNTVFVTKIEWSGPGDEGPEESITFAYGKLGVRYRAQNSDGSMAPAKLQGWDQLINKTWTPKNEDFSGADASK